MKHVLAALLLFLASSALSYAQDFTPRFSVSDRTVGYDLSVNEYAGNSSSGYYAIGMFEGVNVIAKLDSGMRMKDKHAIDKKIYTSRMAPLCEFHSMGDQLWFFKKVYNGKQKRYDLTARSVQKDSLTLSAERTVSSPEKITCELAPSISTGFVFSPDSRRLLSYSPVVSAKDDQELYVKVMDEHLNLLWEKDLHTMVPPSEIKMVKAEAGNDGNIYFLFYRTIIQKHFSYREYHFIACRDNGTYFKDLTFEITDHYIYDCSFDVSPNGDVQVAGTYNLGEDDEIDGTFSIHLEHTGYVSRSPMISPFSEDLLQEFGLNRDSINNLRTPHPRYYANTASQSNSTDSVSSRLFPITFPVMDVHATPDGGVTLLLEHQFTQSQYVTSGDLQSTVDIHTVATKYRLQVLAFHYSATSLLWQDIIYKWQSSSDDHLEHAGFNVFYHGNDTWLLYNDNVQDDQNSYEYTSGEMQLCKLDSAGKIFIHDLQTALPHETILLKLYSYQADENNLLLYCTANFYMRRLRLVMN